MKKIFVFGHRGKVVFAGTEDEVFANDELVKSSGEGFPLLTPMAEVSYDFTPVAVNAPLADKDYQFLKTWAQGIYAEYGLFGNFGDVMHVIEIDDVYIMTAIGVKAYHKPGMASDLVPLIVDPKGRIFWVGILRGQDPGKGQPALIGGFNDIKGFHLESAVECLLHEGREEVGMDISLFSWDVKHEGPFLERAKVSVTLGDLGKLACSMHFVKAIYTSHEEENHSTGLKRVYFTAVYVLPIKVQEELNKDILMELFVPQDLLENNKAIILQVRDEDGRHGQDVDEVNFGIGHHNTAFFAALAKAEEILGLSNK